MARWAILLAMAGLVAAQDKPALKTTHPQERAQEQELPDEDENITPKENYTFNPLQASQEIKIGNFYFKKGRYRAAAMRFREALRWNGSDAQAWLRLGDASEKLKDAKGAREAYAKYLELAPKARNATHIRKKIKD